MLHRVALVLVLLAPAAGAAEDQRNCVAEPYTTVCRNGGHELRVIEDTTSPSRRYGVAWEVPADPQYVKNEGDGSKHLDGGKADNFLIRLDDGKIAATLGGEHFGDHARYNHAEITAVWSPDSRFVAVLYQSKWSTDVAGIYRLSNEGVAGRPLDLMPICREVGKSREARLRRKSPDGYEHVVEVHSIGNDGILSAKCAMQVIKQDDYFAYAVRLKLSEKNNALAARLLGARLCTDENGACAPREPHE